MQHNLMECGLGALIMLILSWMACKTTSLHFLSQIDQNVLVIWMFVCFLLSLPPFNLQVQFLETWFSVHVKLVLWEIEPLSDTR